MSDDQKTAISPAQCRAARALLGMSQGTLAADSGVSEKTVTDFERGVRSPQPRTLRDLRATLEKAGVLFLPENGEGHGVRLRKEQK